MGDLETLQEFGFSAARAKNALKKTKNAGLQQALDYLGDHEEEPTEADLAEDEDEDMGVAAGADGLEAKVRFGFYGLSGGYSGPWLHSTVRARRARAGVCAR